MAKKQKGRILPPVMSAEETRLKPPDPDEEELPPEEDASWDPQSDPTRLLPNTSPPEPSWEGVDEPTPPLPRKIEPIPLDTEPNDTTRPIPRKTGARPALEDPDDATRPIPRKTGVRPALEDPDDATRPIPRRTGARPALPRGAAKEEDPSLPWEAPQDELSSLPTRAQSLPPIVSGPQHALVSPPSGPPVLVPVNTERHYIPPAPSIPVVTQPNYVPPPPAAPASLFTAPNYVPPPPASLSPVVTAPHLIPSSQPPPAGEPPQEGDLRTTFSNKAALVADLVRATFARRSYGTVPYRLRIDEPDGPSTAGGLLARQSISLVTSMDSAPSIVCGWVDVSKKEAQLRSYGVVVRRHQNRHGISMDITEEEYERFLNELVETLFYGGIKILVLVPDTQDPQPSQAQAQAQPQRAGRSCLGTLLLLSLTFALGVGAGLNQERFAPLIEQVRALIQR